MAILSGLLALAVVAADGPSSVPVETTTYQVRVLTLDGLDWRTSSYSRLLPVAHQGMSTIWTADRALVASLADRAKASSPCHTIMAVGEAALTKAENVNYIATMDRVADGPINQSSAIAFMPRPQHVEERFSIQVAGRKLDQGILTRIALEDTHVDVIHGVPQTETLIPSTVKASKIPAELDCQIHNVSTASVTGTPTKTQVTSITSSVQIPEVSQARVEGEWLIPNDGVLIVSLGVKTAADDKGMAVVRERVAVIEASSSTTDSEGRRSKLSAAIAAPTESVKLGQPVVPGRSLPEATDAAGNLIELPPLPEALASADLDRIKPEPYQPSPQAPILSVPSADPALARTSFDAAPAAPVCPAVLGGEFGEDIKIEVSDIVKTLMAGVKGDTQNYLILKNLLQVHATCEKCAAMTICPANAGVMKLDVTAGGMKLVPEVSSQLGAKLKLTYGDDVLEADVKLDDAFKIAGKTETTLIPLGGDRSLQVKATIVPTSPEKAKTAAKKVETPATQR